jgi:hypothetical protein
VFAIHVKNLSFNASHICHSQGFEDTAGKATDALAGELWEVKKERIRQTSKFGGLPGWDLRSVSLQPIFYL